jgi:hypothetical protein
VTYTCVASILNIAGIHAINAELGALAQATGEKSSDVMQLLA